MKIAIFGGSFNPVHNEHVNIVKAAVSALGLDKVIVTPTAITPAKDGGLSASGKDRLEMCRLAFNGVPCAEVSDYEIKRGGVSYTYLTCRAFAEKYPDADRYFIVGADMLDNFHTWKNPEEILSYVKLAVCARENVESLKKSVSDFEQKFGKRVTPFGYVGAAVSSTKLRVYCALGEDISGYTDKKVAEYAATNALYDLKNLQNVKELLTPRRWAHTLRVAVFAAERRALAKADERTVITAAALHDCAKNLPPDSPYLAGFAPPDDVPEAVVHQYGGAYVASRTFGITDADVINAIKYHTSARENMSGLEKLIYLADMLEEGRSFDGVEELRQALNLGLDYCLYKALSHQIKYLQSAGQKIYPLTLRAYEYLKRNCYDE